MHENYKEDDIGIKEEIAWKKNFNPKYDFARRLSTWLKKRQTTGLIKSQTLSRSMGRINFENGRLASTKSRDRPHPQYYRTERPRNVWKLSVDSSSSLRPF